MELSYNRNAALSYLSTTLVLMVIPAALGQTDLQEALCPRIFIRISGTSIAQKIVEGVYVMTDDIYESFPVYSNPATSYMLYSDRYGGEPRFWIGHTKYRWTLQATLRYDVSEWRTWLSSEPEPFRRLIRTWYYYTNTGDTTPVSYAGIDISITCVTNNTSVCPSKRLYLNQTVSQIINGTQLDISVPDVAYYEEVSGITISARPVFRQQNGYVAFLYFSDNFWAIGLNYTGENTFMRCFSTAWRPEFLDCTWELYNSGSYRLQPGLGFGCRGFSADNETVSECMAGNQSASPCAQSAPCGVNSLQEVQCYCPRGYHGEKCQIQTPQCAVEEKIANSAGILTYSKYVGEVETHICNPNASPKFVNSACTIINDQPTRLYTGDCMLVSYTERTTHRKPTTTTEYPTPSPTSSPIPYGEASPTPFNLDSDWLYAVIVTVVVILQFVLPFITCSVVLWKRQSKNDKLEAAKPLRRKLSKKEKSKRETALTRRTQSMYQEWAEKLQEFQAQHPEMEEMTPGQYPEEVKQGLTEINERYGKANKDFEKERKELDLETGDSMPLRRFARSLPCGRIFSIHMFVSFWLWLVFLFVCFPLKCGLYATVFSSFLLIMGIFMVPMAYTWVIIESCYSREKKYIESMGDVEHATTLVDRMRKACPVVVMTATAWHLELRTRSVSYTDANGYTQYRTESYYEKVISSIVSKVFTFNYWLDESDSHLEGVREHGVTAIKMHCVITLGDEETEEAFLKEYKQFKDDNINRDKNVDFEANRTVPGFRSHVTTYMDKETIPKWMNKIVYWITAAIMCTWLFRLVFKKNVAMTEYGLFKRIYMSRPASQEVHEYLDQSTEYCTEEIFEDDESLELDSSSSSSSESSSSSSEDSENCAEDSL